MLAPTNLTFITGIKGTAQLNQVRSNMDSAVLTYQGQAQLTRNPLALVAWAMARVKGQWNETEANLIVVNMLMADLHEEHQVIQGGGLRRMRDIYKARYGANPGMKQYYRDLGRAFEGRDGDAFGDVGIADATTLRGIYATARPTLDNVLARQERADRMQESFRLLTAEFATLNKSNSRVDDLLN
jgi:hypothetical protein